VKLFTESTIGALGPYVDLKIEAGTQATSTFPSCEGFTAFGTGGVVYEGTLSALAAASNSYANGISTFPTGKTKWEADDSVVYKVTATLSSSAPNSAQGATTGSHALTWEAQNQ
jgi:hypothetical protein